MNTQTIHTLLDSRSVADSIWIVSSSIRHPDMVDVRIEHLADPYLMVAYPELCGMLVMGEHPTQHDTVGA